MTVQSTHAFFARPGDAHSLGSWKLTGSEPASIFQALGMLLSSAASYAWQIVECYHIHIHITDT